MAIALLRDAPGLCELQLDLKPHARLTDQVLANLLQIIAPAKERIRVSCEADWAVRRLRALDGAVVLGFDPLLYLDLPPANPRRREEPPFRLGAYGLLDDHPLAARRWGTTAAYLGSRAEALATQVPDGLVWYVRGALLAQALEEGFDWPAYLHARGATVDAWTLDPDSARGVALARHLAGRVDRITTNNAPALAELLAVGAVY